MTASSSHDYRRRERVAENLYRRVSSSGDTRYEVKFRDADGTFRSLTLKGVRTETEAKAEARRILGKRDGGDRVVAINATISAAAEEWFSVLDGMAAAGERSVRGVQEYRDRWRLHIDPRIGRRKLAQIAPEHVAALVTDMRSRGYASNTTRNVLVILGAFYAHARSRGWTSVNPLHGLDANTDIPPAKARRTGRVLDERELRQLCDNTLAGYTSIVTILAYTGLRISEALGLVWANIDLVDAEIEVSQQLSRATATAPAQRVRLKTDNSARRVPMMPVVRESLTSLLATAAAAGRAGDADIVFVTLTGRPMSQRNVASRGVGKAALRAGLGRVSPHDLRRSFCSLAGRRGIDPIIAARITGHSLATWQSAYARDFGKQHRDEAREVLLAAGFGSVR